MNKSSLTSYDELATMLAHPARWLEPFGGLQTPDEIEVGEVTLGDEEAEVDQELQYDAAQGDGGILPGQRMLPIWATITRGRVPGLANNILSVLYRAVIAGGRKEGLFLDVNAIVTPKPPLQG